jgi:hypothetical protein
MLAGLLPIVGQSFLRFGPLRKRVPGYRRRPRRSSAETDPRMRSARSASDGGLEGSLLLTPSVRRQSENPVAFRHSLTASKS